MFITYESVVFEYENILLGKKKCYSHSFNGTDKERRQAFGYLWNYIITHLLKWEPEDVPIHLTKELIYQLHAEQSFKHIDRRIGTIKNINYQYLLALAFPDKYTYDIRKQCLDELEHVMGTGRYAGCTEKYQWPKKFFNGPEGVQRAEIVLNLIIGSYFEWNTIPQMYEYFSDKKRGMAFLKKYHIQSNAKILFNDSPLEYMHYSISDTMKNDFLFNNYTYMEEYKRLQKESRAAARAERQAKKS